MSFTIQCDSCKESLVINNEEDFYSNKSGIGIYLSGAHEAGYGTINIDCACGNTKERDF